MRSARTLDNVAKQHQHVVDDVLAFRSGLEDTLRPLSAQQQRHEAVDIGLDCLLALLLSHLVN